MSLISSTRKLLAAAALLTVAFSSAAVDLDNGNAAIETVIPTAVIGIFDTSPNSGDATLVLRFTTMITNGWFDAVAPYHETAIGVYSDLGRRPAGEATNRNLNIAILHASYHVLDGLFPKFNSVWRDMLINEGLDPDNLTTDLTTPEGIGNMAGKAVISARLNDGMNQLGNEKGVQYHQAPYSDYTGFRPANDAYVLKHPSKWQPAIITQGKGLFQVQQFVTPQLRHVEPYFIKNIHRFRSPKPIQSQIQNYELYKMQADEVLEASANLTEEQMMIAELFDHKIFSLGFSGVYATQVKQLGIMETVHYEFLTNVAAFDTSIVIWKEKHRHNAVRPHSAIEYIYGDLPVTAWGGAEEGTVFDLPASQWTSYLPVADHPEYPSATASFCAAHAQTSRLFLGTDELNWSNMYPAGSSRFYSGTLPSQDIMVTFDTWTDLETRCGLSRYWGGVHFLPSIPAGQELGHRIANKAYKFVSRKIKGKRNKH